MKKQKEDEFQYVGEEDDALYHTVQGEAVKKIKKLQKILKKCKSEKQEYLEGWQRARADQQNYIKQKNIEMEAFRKFASEAAVLQIIPLLDNLILACESIPENIAADNWTKGIMQIRKHFENVLGENGVEMIDAKPGGKFDPVHHEAADETEEGGESGTIAEVVQQGYTLNGKVIRATRVKVIK